MTNRIVSPLRRFGITNSVAVAICILLAWLWVRSTSHREILGWHLIEAGKPGYVMEKFSGVFSGEGRVALGSETENWKKEHFDAQNGQSYPVDEVGGFTLSRQFGESDNEFVLGFGSCSYDWDYPLARGEIRAAMRQGRMPPFVMWRARRFVTVPYWFLMPWPLAWLAWRAWRRFDAFCERRAHPELCPSCGYDLRASPERCPECGTAVEARETPGGGAV